MGAALRKGVATSPCPGAATFALLMIAVRPASTIWLPRALETSADRYGAIGVAFTYLAWLYVVAFCYLATAAIGQVVATDDGRLGVRIRRGLDGPATHGRTSTLSASRSTIAR